MSVIYDTICTDGLTHRRAESFDVILFFVFIFFNNFSEFFQSNCSIKQKKKKQKQTIVYAITLLVIDVLTFVRASEMRFIFCPVKFYASREANSDFNATVLSLNIRE